MKIRINKSKNYKPLLSIVCGECFIPEGSEDEVYLKTHSIGCGNCYKCVDLSTGYIVEFSEMKMVKKVNSEVIVNEDIKI